MAVFNILVLPGDGIGPEVTSAAVQILNVVATRYGHKFNFKYELVGGASIDKYGHPLRAETVQVARRSDAVLFGAVGGPAWDGVAIRPEAAILGLRKALGLYANLRPIRMVPGMEDTGPLKSERVQGTDIIIVRELTGGLYFAKPKQRQNSVRGRRAVDTLRYTEGEIERILRVGFILAQGRRKKLTSVDKANVLESSKLWREVAKEVAADYPDVELEHSLVDSCAMQLIADPTRFDVVVTENMFGDILSDEAAVLVASLGMLPSASLSGLPHFSGNSKRKVKGLYEPIHGTAPDIAGKGIANPVGAVLSAAFMLRYSFGLETEARIVEGAVEKVLSEGFRTSDIATSGPACSTTQMANAIVQQLITSNPDD